MADIELVVKIPEKTYKDIKLLADYGYKSMYHGLVEAISNGTPLPKGHGDLKDVEKLKHTFVMWSRAFQGNFTDADIASIIYNSPTIIEADKESEDK